MSKFDMKIHFCLILILLGMTLSNAAGLMPQTEKWRRVAVILTSQEGLSKQDKPLLYAEKDGIEIANVLSEAGQVEPKDIYRIHENNSEKLLAKIQKVSETIEASKNGEKLFLQVYYSGHGGSNHLHVGNQRIPFESIKNNLGKNLAEARMYVLDVCYGASFFNAKGFKKVKPVELGFDLGDWTNGEVMISSSAVNEQSFETKNLEGSIFTSHWLMALRGAADQNADGQISLFEAYNYTYDQTVRYSEQSLQATQHPSYSMDLNSGKDLILSRPLKNKSALIFENLTPGIYTINDDVKNVPLGEIRLIEKTRYTLAMAPGTYAVSRLSQKGFKESQQIKVSKEPSQVAEKDFKRVEVNSASGKGAPPLLQLGDPRLLYPSFRSLFFVFGLKGGWAESHHQDIVEYLKYDHRFNDQWLISKKEVQSIEEKNLFEIHFGIELINRIRFIFEIMGSQRDFQLVGQGSEELFNVSHPVPIYYKSDVELLEFYGNLMFYYPLIQSFLGYGYVGMGLGLSTYDITEYSEIDRVLVNKQIEEDRSISLKKYSMKLAANWEYPIISLHNVRIDLLYSFKMVFNPFDYGKTQEYLIEDSRYKQKTLYEIKYFNQLGLQIRL